MRTLTNSRLRTELLPTYKADLVELRRLLATYIKNYQGHRCSSDYVAIAEQLDAMKTRYGKLDTRLWSLLDGNERLSGILVYKTMLAIAESKVESGVSSTESSEAFEVDVMSHENISTLRSCLVQVVQSCPSEDSAMQQLAKIASDAMRNTKLQPMNIAGLRVQILLLVVLPVYFQFHTELLEAELARCQSTNRPKRAPRGRNQRRERLA